MELKLLPLILGSLQLAISSYQLIGLKTKTFLSSSKPHIVFTILFGVFNFTFGTDSIDFPLTISIGTIVASFYFYLIFNPLVPKDSGKFRFGILVSGFILTLAFLTFLFSWFELKQSASIGFIPIIMTFYFVIGTTLTVYSAWIEKVEKQKLFVKGCAFLLFVMCFICSFALGDSKYSLLISMNIFFLVCLFELGINELRGNKKIQSVFSNTLSQNEIIPLINTTVSDIATKQLKKQPSEEQLSVLLFLIKGYDIVEIGKLMNRSRGTIGARIDNLREIFDRATIIGIITEAASYGYLYDDLNFYKESGISISKDEYLTNTEMYILQEILKGHKNKEISESSKFSIAKINKVRGKINKKWSIDSKADLVFKAITKNYLQLHVNTPILNGQDQEAILTMFNENSNKELKGQCIYKLVYSSPSTCIIRLTKRQRETLELKLKGLNDTSIAAKLKISKESIFRHLKEARITMSVDKIGELIIKSIDTGLIVLDNVQSIRIKSFKAHEEHYFLELAKLLIGSDPTTIPGIKQEDANKILRHFQNLWNVESIEGLLINAIVRGELTDSQLRAIENESKQAE